MKSGGEKRKQIIQGYGKRFKWMDMEVVKVTSWEEPRVQVGSQAI
jgi:hypothetical protein